MLGPNNSTIAILVCQGGELACRIGDELIPVDKALWCRNVGQYLGVNVTNAVVCGRCSAGF